MTRVLVCGGRNYADANRAAAALNQIHQATPITVIIHGAATGADELGRMWATQRGIPTESYPAEWSKIDTMPCLLRVRNGKPYNALAGFARNTRMLLQGCPEIVVALPGERGTADMVRKALKAGVPVLEVER